MSRLSDTDMEERRSKICVSTVLFETDTFNEGVSPGQHILSIISNFCQLLSLIFFGQQLKICHFSEKVLTCYL